MIKMSEKKDEDIKINDVSADDIYKLLTQPMIDKENLGHGVKTVKHYYPKVTPSKYNHKNINTKDGQLFFRIDTTLFDANGTMLGAGVLYKNHNWYLTDLGYVNGVAEDLDVKHCVSKQDWLRYKLAVRNTRLQCDLHYDYYNEDYYIKLPKLSQIRAYYSNILSFELDAGGFMYFVLNTNSIDIKNYQIYMKKHQAKIKQIKKTQEKQDKAQAKASNSHKSKGKNKQSNTKQLSLFN